MTTKQSYIQVPLAVGLAWGNDTDRFIYEEKMDGVWSARDVGNSVIVGESMRNGQFFAFDVPVFHGENVRLFPLSERLKMLDGLLSSEPGAAGMLRPVRGSGGEFVRAVLERGGEGVVRKPLVGKWSAPLEKCKRSENFIVRVTDFVPDSQSVCIEDADSGETRGKIALRGGKCDSVRVGSVLKLNGFGLTAKGLIREPRLDTDAPGSWLVRF